ncbi:MAG: transporter substrate-binding domain-containing protein [Spirochaetales bacterium]|nr:transporter substrate-binding domain-containing protein [Spirochaetales bacterium]
MERTRVYEAPPAVRVVILVIAASLMPVHAGAETVRTAVFQLEPFTMEDPQTGEITGISVEYWRRCIAPRMDVELLIVGLVPLARLERLLENGEIDVIIHFTWTPERAETFIYARESFTSIQPCVVVPSDSPLMAVSRQEDLFGMTLGFMISGYPHAFIRHEQITVENVSADDFRGLNLKKLRAGRLDGVFDMNYISMLYYLARSAHRNSVRVLQLPVEPVPVYSVFRRTPEGRRLADAFGQANRDGIAAGAYEKITAEFFGRAYLQELETAEDE